jgi:uncharacterized metal-binding protein YceD (DUF177 family)
MLPALIEDEILLALPTRRGTTIVCCPGLRRESAKVSPFSVLAGLQGQG